MAINENIMDLAKYKGPIVACPFCPPAIDQLTSRAACRMCMGRKFISLCLNCDHTGQYKGRTVWDGGANEHTSTCTPCGGSGFFPSNGPATAKWIKSDKHGVPAEIQMLNDARNDVRQVALGSGEPPTLIKPGEVMMPPNAPDGAHVVESTATPVT